MFSSFMMSKKHLQSVSLLHVHLHPQVPHLVLLHQQVVLQGLQVLVFQYEQLCITEDFLIVSVSNLSSECGQVGPGGRSCEYPGTQIQTCGRGRCDPSCTIQLFTKINHNKFIILQEVKSFIMDDIFQGLPCNCWM